MPGQLHDHDSRTPHPHEAAQPRQAGAGHSDAHDERSERAEGPATEDAGPARAGAEPAEPDPAAAPAGAQPPRPAPELPPEMRRLAGTQRFFDNLVLNGIVTLLVVGI